MSGFRGAGHFYDQYREVIVGEKGAIFVTQDGGKSWERKVSPKEISLFDVVLYGENQGIAIGVLGLILQTSDGGKTWSQIDSPVKDSLIAAKVTDRSTILVGARGTFLVSTDENKTF
ncbi:MAG: YCF48-related protein [Thermodesulfobacteriota bacterium]|nr:MAG: YCF48-related protein [Thermodesulfobacteriota bacterium]